MITTFCPNCETERPAHSVRKTETFKIRGLDIPVEVDYLTCDTCGAAFDSPRTEDPLAAAFHEYRKRRGLVQPEEIRDFRREYGFTQQELAGLLGWGAATLSRYENGALQDEAHDRALRMVMVSENLLALLERHPDALTPEKRQAVIAQVQSESSPGSDLLGHIEHWLVSHDPDESSGYQRFSPAKFFNAVLFFCRGEGVPKTKLNKQLWYADFLHFKQHALSITGARYAHCTHGPAPDKYEVLFAYLQDCSAGLRTEDRFSAKFAWEVLCATREPELGVFSDTELQTLLDVNRQFKDFGARQIRDFSHREKGYRETTDGELISYRYADDLLI